MTDRDDHLQLFMAISIALHALLFLFYLSPLLSKLSLPSMPAPIELVEIPRGRMAATRVPVRIPAPAPIPPPPQARPEKAKAEPIPVAEEPLPPEQPPGDVVEIPRPAVEQAPRDQRFRSLYNQRVPRPARARDLPIDTRGLPTSRKSADALAKPTLRETKERAAEAQEAQEAQKAQARMEAGGRAGAGGDGSATMPGVAGERGDEVSKPIVEDGVFQRRAKPRVAAVPGAGRPGLPGVGSGLRDLLPTEERIAQLERGRAGGQNNPYNPDLVPTDATMSMDTLKDENAGYWLAVKRRIALNWDPIRLIRAAKDMYDQTAANFGSTSGISQSAQTAIGEAASRTGAGTTKIKFTIAKDGGQGGEPRITRSSGSNFLDQEALKAVRLGYPFPPVPDRLTRNSLTLEFTFIVGGE